MLMKSNAVADTGCIHIVCRSLSLFLVSDSPRVIVTVKLPQHVYITSCCHYHFYFLCVYLGCLKKDFTNTCHKTMLHWNQWVYYMQRFLCHVAIPIHFPTPSDSTAPSKKAYLQESHLIFAVDIA